jgi:hypothetical protein
MYCSSLQKGRKSGATVASPPSGCPDIDPRRKAHDRSLSPHVVLGGMQKPGSFSRTAFAMATLPSPVQSESLPMPRNHRLWLDDDEGGSPASPQTREPNPQEPVGSAQTNATASAGALQDQQLMAECQDPNMQSCASSEAARSGEKQRDEDGKHDSGSLHVAASQIQLFQ